MTAPARGNWFTRGGWWFVVQALSLGILAPIPFTHAAVRIRRPLHVVLAVLSVVLVIGTLAVLGSADKNALNQPVGTGATVGTIGIFVVWLGGLAALIPIRRQAYPPPRTTDPAIATALAARERRAEARRLAASDPMLAREIRIGRPDLPRTYDDGGLVDLNGAPAGVIAQVVGLDPAHAASIVQARQAAGRFGSVDDVFAYASLPYEVWDTIRDRAVVIG